MAQRSTAVEGAGEPPVDGAGRAHPRLPANLGVALLWVGLQLLALAALLLLRRGGFPTAAPVIVGATAASAAGWALLSGGSHRPSAARATIAAAARALRPGAVAGAVLLSASVPAVTADLGPTSVPPVVGAGQVLLLAVFLRWSADRRGTPPPARPWAPASAVIAAFLAASLITSLLGLDDVYPFSRYPMYSAARVGEYQVEHVTFEGLTIEGERVALRRPASRQVLLRLVADEEHDRLGRLARDATRGRDFDRVEVAAELVRVAPHPAPVGIEVVERTLVLDVETGGDDT